MVFKMAKILLLFLIAAVLFIGCEQPLNNDMTSDDFEAEVDEKINSEEAEKVNVNISTENVEYIMIGCFPSYTNYKIVDNDNIALLLNKINSLALARDFPENPNEYVGASYDIDIFYADGTVKTVHFFGNMFLMVKGDSWLRVKYGEAFELDILIEKIMSETGEYKEPDTYAQMCIEWPHYDTVEALVNDVAYVFRGKVSGISFEVIDTHTGRPAQEGAQDEALLLYTVYEITPVKFYKGEEKSSMYIAVPGGIRERMEEEQLAILDHAGITPTIPIVEGALILEEGAEYLFAACDLGSEYLAIPCMDQFAFPPRVPQFGETDDTPNYKNILYYFSGYDDYLI